jgi:hypothetical protein
LAVKESPRARIVGRLDGPRSAAGVPRRSSGAKKSIAAVRTRSSRRPAMAARRTTRTARRVTRGERANRFRGDSRASTPGTYHRREGVGKIRPVVDHSA